jgi:Transcriptional regulator
LSHSIMTEMTKKVLAESLKKLMATKPLNKITIRDITDDCKLNRQTFYYHFQDVYDLLSWIYQEEAIAQLRKHNDFRTWQEDFLDLFHYIESTRAFSLCAFHSIGRDRLEHFLYTVTYCYIQNVVNKMAGDLPVTEKSKNFVANFYTIAFIGIVIQWLQNGMSDSPEDIIAALSVTVEGNMRGAIERYANLTSMQRDTLAKR